MTTARALMRLSLVSLAFLAACGKPVGGGAIELVIELEPGLTSQCVKAFATDGTNTLPSELIVLRGKTSPLRVGVFEATLSSPVTLWAQGYSDTGCTVETPGEVSERVMASFANPPAVVTVTLAPVQQSGLDGGADAGLPDAGMNDAGLPDAGAVDSGVDAGADAGLDQDMDGFPAGVDCNDTNATVYPGAPELCGDGLDNNCNGTIDCFDLLNCDGQLCAGGGRCSSMTCMQPHETVCNDGLDNDMDMLVDCLDPDCTAGSTCNDSNACTTGERCVADAGCEKTGDVVCNSPPAAQCWVAAGVCQLDGGQCAYTPMAGSCNDNLACTTGDSCANGTCAGAAVTCGAPPVCRGAGACQESAGACVFPALAQGTGTCSDGNNCTTGDSCDGDGGCTGTLVTCTPNQCQQANGCSAAGACQFIPKTGQPCTAGTAMPATCDSNANCVVTPASAFPYTPSNFTDAQLAKPDAGQLNVNCDVTINTSGTPSVTGNCFVPQTISTFTPSGANALQTVFIQVNGLNVNFGRTITVTGNRPLIIAVLGNAQIDGAIVANNSGGTSGDCGNGGTAGTRGGGGGGGFGGAGAAGGDANTGVTGGTAGSANGTTSLAPLRGGCDGSAGATGGAGGVGGGAVQLSASGTLVVAGAINAPGKGGAGATSTANGNGGGGGGSGGGVLLEGVTVTVSGFLTANGGGGGKGSRGSSGSPGLDGEQTLNGGLGGFVGSTNAGNGGRGGGRAAAPVAGSPGQDATSGGGGGGGGTGRLRLNAMTSCSVTGVVSPSASSNGTTGCP